MEILHLRHQIPPKFKLEVAGPEDQIALPPYGWLGLSKSLKVGLRLPLHFFIIKLPRAYEIPLCGIALNSWRSIIAFITHLLFLGVELTIRLFRAFFCFKEYRKKIGWWYASPRLKCRLFREMRPEDAEALRLMARKKKFIGETSALKRGCVKIVLAQPAPVYHVDHFVGILKEAQQDSKDVRPEFPRLKLWPMRP
ncbi:hypothetical protein COCNU_scaffold000258G000020 [Cocos nucifera]|nr:hypothetical protein [Cocos nucifera]